MRWGVLGIYFDVVSNWLPTKPWCGTMPFYRRSHAQIKSQTLLIPKHTWPRRYSPFGVLWASSHPLNTAWQVKLRGRLWYPTFNFALPCTRSRSNVYYSTPWWQLKWWDWSSSNSCCSETDFQSAYFYDHLCS